LQIQQQFIAVRSMGWPAVNTFKGQMVLTEKKHTEVYPAVGYRAIHVFHFESYFVLDKGA
jgi:hypothetical protein